MWLMHTMEFDTVVNRKDPLLRVTTQTAKTYSLGGKSPGIHNKLRVVVTSDTWEGRECGLGEVVKEDFNLNWK